MGVGESGGSPGMASSAKTCSREARGFQAEGGSRLAASRICESANSDIPIPFGEGAPVASSPNNRRAAAARLSSCVVATPDHMTARGCELRAPVASGPPGITEAQQTSMHPANAAIAVDCFFDEPRVPTDIRPAPPIPPLMPCMGEGAGQAGESGCGESGSAASGRKEAEPTCAVFPECTSPVEREPECVSSVVSAPNSASTDPPSTPPSSTACVCPVCCEPATESAAF
mmetsp:Transcript_25203/g.64019  ORF Transcript_25203/g.64019 Transcript_25203/m.64019 type:complete len:229 (+) Transcript_25203:341-1027(+)